MSQIARFAYAEPDLAKTGIGSLPYVPVVLRANTKTVPVSVLVDSGAMVSVLPYHVGEQLGLVWEKYTVSLQLTGNLAQAPARVVVIETVIAPLDPIYLMFAWTQRNDVPVIFGQFNFFDNFDVCFFRSQSAFEVTPKSGD